MRECKDCCFAWRICPPFVCLVTHKTAHDGKVCDVELEEIVNVCNSTNELLLDVAKSYSEKK